MPAGDRDDAPGEHGAFDNTSVASNPGTGAMISE
jgi:hypothetical protein